MFRAGSPLSPIGRSFEVQHPPMLQLPKGTERKSVPQRVRGQLTRRKASSDSTIVHDRRWPGWGYIPRECDGAPTVHRIRVSVTRPSSPSSHMRRRKGPNASLQTAGAVSSPRSSDVPRSCALPEAEERNASTSLLQTLGSLSFGSLILLGFMIGMVR